MTHSENEQHAYDTWLKIWYWTGKFWKHNRRSKKTMQYDLNMNIIKERDCAKDASRELNINYSNMRSCLQWIINTAWGFIWIFKWDELSGKQADWYGE